MLADQEPGLTRGLYCALFDVGDCGIELAAGRRRDDDEGGVAEDAVSGGEIGLLLEAVWYSTVRRASSIRPIRARSAASVTARPYVGGASGSRVGAHRVVEQGEASTDSGAAQ